MSEPAETTVTKAEAERGRFFDARPAIARELLASRDRRVLVDGPLGTGKSRLLLEKLRACCLKYPGCRWLLLRSVRKWLTNSALVTLEEKVLEPGLLIPDRIRRENRSEYRFLNGSVIVVAGLDDPQGVFSAEYDGAVLIEGIEIDQDTGEKVDGRLRYGRMPYQQFLIDCNPGPPTHWLKRAAETGWLTRMPMRHRDNPALVRADGTLTRQGRDYLGRLDGLTGVRRRRLRDGEWVQAEGVVFEGWDSTVHIVAPFAIPRHWRRYWSIDFGFTNPFVWQWWAEDDDGRLYLYREIYRTRGLVSDHAVAGLRAMHAWDETLQQPCWVDADDPRPAAVLCDHDAEDRATFERVVKLPTEPAPKAVDAGLQDVADRLKPADDGKPRIFVFRNARCHEPDTELIQSAKPAGTADEFDSYIWDPACRKGERPLKQDDHGCLSAGTMVLTDKGEVAIENVRAGCNVWTRDGWKPVVAAGLTSYAAKVHRIEFDNGSELIATGDHPIWTEQRGFARVDELEYDAITLCIEDDKCKLSKSTFRPNHVLARVLRVNRMQCAVPVFNLTVKDCPEFFANGILVHNCDAMRYIARYKAAGKFHAAEYGADFSEGEHPPGVFG